MKENRYYIDVILEKEKIRNVKMQLSYKKRIEDLPKGGLVIRNINGKEYCYLRYREGNKIIQKYAGKIENVDTIRSQIDERKHLLKLVHMLEEEYERIKKMEGIK